MPTLFFRLHTDGTPAPGIPADAFAGPARTACWIIGGGPSLGQMPCEEIARSPVAKLGVNLAGTGVLRPNLWTSYDPSARFHRSVYLDASIVKFVHRRRAMDLVPETTFKVCDCPNLYFFDSDRERGFADFLPATRTLGASGSLPGIIDWNDSLLQAIDIAYRLGFRVLYLAGCDMHVRPSAEQVRRARKYGVEFEPLQTLDGFVRACESAGLSRDELQQLVAPAQYHFAERKSFDAAVQTDLHYFRVSQYLRLARRSLALAGVELVSVTPGSRLNDYFPYRSAQAVLSEIHAEVGCPETESTAGRYSLTGPRSPRDLGPMRDFRPHHWPQAGPRKERAEQLPAPPVDGGDARERLRAALDDLPETPVHLNEQG